MIFRNERMKSFLPLLLLVCCCNSVRADSCPEQIRTFYACYLNNILLGNSNAALCRTYLTQGLSEKVRRIGNATGGDPVIRAQDANQDAIETLTVTELGNDWYRVGYLWKKGDEHTRVEIPLKAQRIDDSCKITYIVPIWHGSRFGDDLRACRNEGTIETDTTSGLAFLKSFYEAYLAFYCAMPADLNAELSSLRSRCLSRNALEQYANAASENLQDGLEGYDLLIDNFDFDCLWCDQIEFTHLAGDDYQVAYKGDMFRKIVVTLQSRADGYRIGSLKIQKSKPL